MQHAAMGTSARDHRRVRSGKRDLILDAAIHVFARMGYHGARISDIAREAGIAYGLVYHYFKNKEEILGTLFEERWGGFVEAVEGIADGSGSTAEKLDKSSFRIRPIGEAALPGKKAPIAIYTVAPTPT